MTTRSNLPFYEHGFADFERHARRTGFRWRPRDSASTPPGVPPLIDERHSVNYFLPAVFALPCFGRQFRQ